MSVLLWSRLWHLARSVHCPGTDKREVDAVCDPVGEAGWQPIDNGSASACERCVGGLLPLFEGAMCVGHNVCYNKDGAVSPARLVRGHNVCCPVHEGWLGCVAAAGAGRKE